MTFNQALSEYESSIQPPIPIPAWLGAFVDGAFTTTVLTDPSLTYARYLDDTPTVVKHRNQVNLNTTDQNVPISLYWDEFNQLAILGIDTVQAGAVDPGESIPAHTHAASQIVSGTLAQARGGLNTNVSALSGLLKNTAGVASAVAAPSGAVVGDTDNQTLTNKTLTTPTIADFTNAQHDHLDADDGGTLSAAAIASGTLALARGGSYIQDLSVNVTEVGNVGTGEDDLITYTVVGGTLATNLDRLHYEFALTGANNANAKRARVYLDDTPLFDSGALPTSVALSIIIRGTIIRESQSVQKTSTTMITSSASLPALVNVVGCAEDLSTSLVLKVTGEATSNNDLVCESLTVDLVHAP